MSAVCWQQQQLCNSIMQPQVQPPYSSRQRRDGQSRRDPPPPYPGNPRHLYTPRYRQSYSGSEASTDISLSSTENLSTSARQEPQGEETSSLGLGPPTDPSPSLLAQLGLSPLPTESNGLEVKTTNSSTFYVTGSMQPAYTAATGHHQYHQLQQQEMSGMTQPPPPELGHGCQAPATMSGQAHPAQVCTTMSALYNQPAVTSDNPTIYSNSPNNNNHHHNNSNNNNNVYSTSPLLQTHFEPPPQYRSNQNFVNMRYSSSPTPSCEKQQPDIYQYQQNQLAPPAQYGHPLQDGQQVYNRNTSVSPIPQKSSSGCGSPGRAGSNQSSPTESRQVSQLCRPSHAHQDPMPSPPRYPHRQKHQTGTYQQSRTPSTTSPTSARTTEFIPSTSRPKPQLPARPKSAEPRYSLEGRRFAVAPPLPDPIEILPPPEYRNPPSKSQSPSNPFHADDMQDPSLQKSSDILNQLTRSQPDLTRVTDMQNVYRQRPASASLKAGEVQQQQQRLQQQQKQQQQLLSQWSTTKSTSPVQCSQKKELDHAAVATRATQMVERLYEENRSLRKELEGYYKKVCKMQKFEQEIQKVKDAHESLVRHSQKRENLEKIMRYKLESELKKVTDTSKELKEQLDKALTHLSQKGVYNTSDPELKEELPRKDSIISKLISQNRELSTNKERLESDFSAQKAVIQDQRLTIEVLDTALHNTQTTIAKYEEELRKKKVQDEKMQQLQHTMTQLHMNNEKRDVIEHKLRSKLEDDLRNLQSQQNGASKLSDTDEGISSDMESPTSMQSLIQQMQNKEQRVLELESEIVRWEQRFLEESALRQLAIDAASIPKEARIAALEESSAETEKMIGEARSERLHHLEEVFQANKRAAELQAKVKMLQAQLAEKDAMIKVLQRHSSLSRTGSVSSLFASPVHSPRPSIMSGTSLISSASPLTLSGLSTTSSANTSMSLSLSSPPPSGASSRQSSQLDTALQMNIGTRQNSQGDTVTGGSGSGSPSSGRESKLTVHSKSSSTVSGGQASSGSSSDGEAEASRASHEVKDISPPTEVQSKLALQTALLGKDGSEKLKKCLWQV